MDKRQEQISLLTNEEPIDEETQALSEEIGKALNELLDAYITDEEYDDNLRNILEDDDYLTEELIDKIAFLNFLEAAPKDEFSKEDTEHIYLSVIDSFFELSKLISPLNGFGRDRLEAGLSLIRLFEEQYWPVSTRIVPENAEAFSELIPVEHYEDIMAGRKYAIGALRHIGEEVYAAGVVVYSIYDEEDDYPLVNIEWIMAHESVREQGVGNFLMAQVIEIALMLNERNKKTSKSDGEEEALFEMDETAISVELPVKQTDDEEELREFHVTENFFDSWKFGFSMTYGSKFIIKLSDVGESDMISRKKNDNMAEVRSLGELGDKGNAMLKAFFKRRNQKYDADIVTLPYDFFDPDVSCVTFSGKDISSVLLFHRFENGDYRYECFRCIEDEYIRELPKLIAHAYAAASGREDGDNMISGSFDSEEGYEIAGKIIPNARVLMVYRGVMYPPLEIITSEEWGKLRLEAGFSNDKIPEEELTDEDIQEKDVELMKTFIANNGFK